MFSPLFLSLVLAVVGVALTLAQPLADLITDLDGLTWAPNYKQYSGYLSLPTNDHQYFYWLTESQSNPLTDPLVLWLNGGPGCSSIGDGLFYENGPIHINDDASLYNNEKNAWNQYANMLYLDTPICTGFSYNNNSDENANNRSCEMTVDQNAEDNYYALQSFLEKFRPLFANNSFYITGESFAGVLIPTLTLKVLQMNELNHRDHIHIHLQGFAIGNGRLNIELNYNSIIWYAYFHGLISSQIWNSLMTYCCVPNATEPVHDCNFMLSTNLKCREYAFRTMTVAQKGRVNPYDLYGPCYHFKGQAPTRNGKLNPLTEGEDDRYGDRDIITCSNTKGADTFFNRHNVRQQIHVRQNDSSEWLLCKDTPEYTIEMKYDDMSHVFHNIFDIHPQIYGVFYYGDTDMNQNVLGGSWFVNKLASKFGYSAINEYREWYYNKTDAGNVQVGGWTQDFTRFSLVTVRGAGHMVPQLRPKQALKMFHYFLMHQQL